MLWLIGLAGHQPEGWRQGPEFRRGNEGEIDLQSAGEQEYAINPRTGMDVKMIESLMPVVHVGGPIGQDIRQLAGIPDSKGEIYIRPSIFARRCRRAGNRGARDALIIYGASQETGAQALTFF